ncbi:MAG: hypothetical protein Q8910_16000, partial [Bacteroidota bacterium]|nr:hypothetical protein [Bacteroidota bacterium]
LNNLDVYVGGDFTNNGAYNPGSGNAIFNGSGAQTAQLNSATSFYKLTVYKADGVLTFAGSKQPVITDTLSILNGTLNDGTATVSVLGDVINNAVHSSGSGNITLAGSRKQMISGNGNGRFGNLVINNGKDNGAALTANTTINGILTLGSGPFYLDDNLLTLGTSASIGGSPGATHLRNWIMTNGVLSDGGVRKVFPLVSPASFTFPVGVAKKYTPASYTLTYTSPGTITVKPVDGPVPSVTSLANDQLQYYWNVTSASFSGLTSANHIYQFVVSDVKGNKENYLGARYNFNDYTWTQYTSPDVIDVVNYTINLKGLNYIDGDYTCGIVGNFGDKPVYYSYDNAPNITTAGADWNSAGTWAIGGHNGTVATVPPTGNPIVIKSSHVIHVNNDDRTAYSIVNEGILNLHSTTGHNFGHVSGAGRIIMSNTPAYQFVFPGGNYDDFMNTAGSTIEYYGIGTNIPCISPIIKSYQNLEFTGPASKNLSNVNILVRGNLKISESQVINSLYDKNITLWGNWSDNVTNGFVPGYGTVYFTGSALQTINSTNPEHFYNFSVNNAAGLTINGTSEIANSLYLVKGNVNTDATNSLTLTNTNPLCISGGSSASFVNGPLKKYIQNGSYFDFPVGKSVPSSRFGKVGVMNTSTIGAQVWTAEYFNTVPPNNSQVALPLDHISDNEYWNVTGPSGGSANVCLRWDALSNIQPLTVSGRQKLRVA